jgi:drug/metabolite transporter (DMT)-like permease
MPAYTAGVDKWIRERDVPGIRGTGRRGALLVEIVTILLALAAAIQFGLTVYVQNIGLRHTDAVTGAFLSVGSTAAMFWILSPLFIEWRWWFTEAALLFALCGLIFPALGQRLQIASLAQVGPALTAAVGSFTPVFAVLPAVFLLGETFDATLAAGLVLLMAGLLVLVLRPRSLQWNWPIWALLLPLGAACARGIVQPVAKLGLGLVPSPFFPPSSWPRFRRSWSGSFSFDRCGHRGPYIP